MHCHKAENRAGVLSPRKADFSNAQFIIWMSGSGAEPGLTEELTPGVSSDSPLIWSC